MYAGNRLFGTKKNGAYQWITYGEFGALVDAMRSGLKSLGVEKGDRVAIISDNRVQWAVMAYATYSLGGAFVPMYEKQNPKDWAFIVGDCGAKVLVVPNDKVLGKTEGFVEEFETLTAILNLGDAGEHTYDKLIEYGKANPVEATELDPEDTAGFIYTSGTTGNPKGVILSHGNFASNVNAVQEIFPMAEDDVSLSFLPWAHSFGQTCELHCMIANGASVGLAESVQTIIQNLPEVRPTLLFSVPRIFNKIYDGLNKKMAKAGGLKKKLFDSAIDNANYRRRLADQGQTSWWVDTKHSVFDKLVFSKVREAFGGRLKYAFSGGAALAKEVAMFIDNLNITVYEGYGLSETSPICTANYPGTRRIGSVGKALPGVKVVIDPVEHIKEEGAGEVVVYGPNIMKGYYNLDEETKKVFTKDGGFRTGDLGRFDKDGFLFIIGRVKEQYKLENGKYVVPAPLEELLKLSPYVNQAMIYGMNKPYNVALIVPDEVALKEWAAENGKSGDLAELVKTDEVKKLYQDQIAEYAKEFKGYERPKKFDFVLEEFSTDNDMLTPSLKLKRRNVVKAYMDRIDALFG